jgi:methionyl-tRNA formyltransferase
MKKYRAVFIGNRPLILSSLVEHHQIHVVHAFIIQGSLICQNNYNDIPITICNSNDASQVLNFLKFGEYDICISAGCPYILPINLFPLDKVFINSHPSALPFGRGCHPINECIFSSHKKAGATLHYLTEKLDAGDIIYQTVFDVTDDIDLDLLYSIIFEIENEVFIKGLENILSANLKYSGNQQQGMGTYYSRKKNDQYIDICSISTTDFLKKVRAFSTDSLGIHINLEGKDIVVFMASLISNEFINKRFDENYPGKIIISNNKFLIIKLKDGIIRIDKWALK